MLHKEFWGILFLAFVGWIFIAANPTDRIEHFCRPVEWSGNISTSIAALIVPSQQKTVQTWFDKFDYGCQYATWRLVYQADYNKAMGISPKDNPVPATEAEKKPNEAKPVEKAAK